MFDIYHCDRRNLDKKGRQINYIRGMIFFGSTVLEE